MKITDPKNTAILEDFISGKIQTFCENNVNPVIEKTDDIRQNILNGYYTANKYNMMYFGNFKNYLDGMLMAEISEFIDNNYHGSIYNTIMKEIKNIVRRISREKNVQQNSDTWWGDFQTEHNISDKVANSISSIIYDKYSDAQEYDKYDFAVELLEFRNLK